eukprot:gnl/Trimastix_PCT/625.p1 GENE.gnl/Trimastix_PCT/625~~gnl/Trimastix_PCT/625.p1  ORF type:complete len:325 (-),score=63.58 gnl/Trimastix_PCT/625:60-1034(-)
MYWKVKECLGDIQSDHPIASHRVENFLKRKQTANSCRMAKAKQFNQVRFSQSVSVVRKRLDAVIDGCLTEDEKRSRGRDILTRRKRDAIDSLRSIRQDIGLRDSEVAAGKGDSQEVRQLGVKIRQGIRKVEDMAAQIEQETVNREAEARKKNASDNTKMLAEKSREVLNLVKENIDLCKEMDRAPEASNREELLDGGRAAFNAQRAANVPQHIQTMSSGERNQAWMMLQQKEQEELDPLLDQVAQNVGELGQMARNFSAVLDQHEQMLTEIDKKVDKNIAKVQDVNKKVKRANDMAGKGSNRCLNIILILIIVAVAGYILTRVL